MDVLDGRRTPIFRVTRHLTSFLCRVRGVPRLAVREKLDLSVTREGSL